jgi:hypothetical protein
MCARRLIDRAFLRGCSIGWVRSCVRPVDAARMAAGHNALRGSDPGQTPAFDNALARVGCPDRRIDRLFLPSIYPRSLRARRNVSMGGQGSVARIPIVTIFPPVRCALAVSGQAAAPATSPINSRRFMCGWPPPGKRKCSVPHRSRLQSCVRPVHAVRRDCWP